MREFCTTDGRNTPYAVGLMTLWYIVGTDLSGSVKTSAPTFPRGTTGADLGAMPRSG